jgi:hypothetical protein
MRRVSKCQAVGMARAAGLGQQEVKLVGAGQAQQEVACWVGCSRRSERGVLNKPVGMPAIIHISACLGYSYDHIMQLSGIVSDSGCRLSCHSMWVAVCWKDTVVSAANRGVKHARHHAAPCSAMPHASM